MAYAEPPDGGDIRATLALSQAEAQTGSSRTLNLPGGRRITISIPAGIHNGEEIRLKGQGEPTWVGGPTGDLVLTISIPADSFAGQSNPGFNQNTPTEYFPAPYLPPTASSPNYPPATTPGSPYPPHTAYPQQQYTATTPAGNYANYPQPVPQAQQDPIFLPQEKTVYADPSQYAAYPQPGQQGLQPPPSTQQPRRRKVSPVVTILIVVLVLLLLVGSGLIYYVGIYQPKVMHDQATTATAQAQMSATALANNQATQAAVASLTAQAQATTNAQASATAQVSATASAFQNILTSAMSGTQLLSNPLNAQTNNQWDILAPANSSVGGSCAFANGAYHSNMPTKGYFQPCYAGTPTFANFAFQVDMTITQGDEGGILFRADPANNKFYLFRITQNGAYDLFLYNNGQGTQAQSLLSGTVPGFKTGPNLPNTIAVVAKGSTLYFYINGLYLNNVSDGTFASGKIGVFGESSTSPTDVAFANAKVWQA
jgi:flagellar basal body-associated protein FliL